MSPWFRDTEGFALDDEVLCLEVSPQFVAGRASGPADAPDPEESIPHRWRTPRVVPRARALHVVLVLALVAGAASMTSLRLDERRVGSLEAPPYRAAPPTARSIARADVAAPRPHKRRKIHPRRRSTTQRPPAAPAGDSKAARAPSANSPTPAVRHGREQAPGPVSPGARAPEPSSPPPAPGEFF